MEEYRIGGLRMDGALKFTEVSSVFVWQRLFTEYLPINTLQTPEDSKGAYLPLLTYPYIVCTEDVKLFLIILFAHARKQDTENHCLFFNSF